MKKFILFLIGFNFLTISVVHSTPNKLTKSEDICFSSYWLAVDTSLFSDANNAINYCKDSEDNYLLPNFLISELYSMRGYDKYSQGDKDGAISDFNKAIKLDPKNPTPFVYRGLVSIEKKNNEKGCDDLSKSFQLAKINEPDLAVRVAKLKRKYCE